MVKTARKSSHRKKTAKKKTGKKPSEVRIQVTVLRRAPARQEFVLLDGRKLRDLRELAFALGDMADDVFWHHANDVRNDFVSWVNDVFKDKELSDALRNARDRFNAQLTVLRHIVKKL